MYDPSFFVEREQYISKVKEFIDDNFDTKLHEIFMEVIEMYGAVVDAARDYESCVVEGRKRRLARRYEKVAGMLQRYVDLLREAMDRGGDMT